MVYKRTEKDKSYNNYVCHVLYKKYWLSGTNKTSEIPWSELQFVGYKGSYPYGVPTCYTDYWIRQITDYQRGMKRYLIIKP